MKVYVTNENNRLLRNLNDGVDLTKWINDQIARGYISSGVSTLASLTDVDLTGVQPEYVLTYDTLTSKWVPKFSAATAGNPAGSTGQIQFNNNGVFGASSNLFWDNANARLGLGTNAPTQRLSVNGSVGVTAGTGSLSITTTASARPLSLSEAAYRNFHINYPSEFVTELQFGLKGFLEYDGDGGILTLKNTSDELSYSVTRFVMNQTERARINQSGDFLIGTTTNTGSRLTVRGTGTTSATTSLLVQNSTPTNLFRVNDDGTFLIGQAVSALSYISGSNSGSFYRAGGTGHSFNYINVPRMVVGEFGTSFTNSNNSLSGDRSGLLNSSTFNPTSGTANYFSLNLQSTINQTGGSNGVTRGLFVNPTLTSAFDWRSIEWNNNTGWGLYGAGTANNYLAGSLGIGTTSLNNSALNVLKTITGSTVVNSIINNSTIASDVTTEAAYYSTNAGTLNASFTLSFLEHYAARQGTFGLSSTVINQYGFFVSSGLTGATNNYGFFGNIPSGTGRWNLYMNGTANNYIAGNTSIGTTQTGAQLNVRGSGTTNGIDALLVEASDGTDLFEVENGGLISVGKNVGATTQSTATIRVISDDTNTGLALVPKGSGAITAQIPDNTPTGGEARGNNAVDFQMSRSSTSEVAKGAFSVVVGGQSNTAFASRSVVLGGQSNNASGDYSSITGGTGNTAGGASSVVSGGTTNSSGGANSCIGGGQSNSSSGAHSTVCGGQQNTASGSYSTVVGGLAGLANIPYQTVLGSNGVFGFVGDNQTSVVRVRATSTSNQVTEMFIAGSTRLVLVLPANTTTRV